MKIRSSILLPETLASPLPCRCCCCCCCRCCCLHGGGLDSGVVHNEWWCQVHNNNEQFSSLLKEYNVYRGGSSIGKGLTKAANFYLNERSSKGATTRPPYLDLPGAADLNKECECECEWWNEWAATASPPPNDNDAFYVVDIGILVSQFWQWRQCFPRVEPFYAVKCNPDPLIIKTLALLGCNFDCASRQEIRLVQDCCKDLLLAADGQAQEPQPQQHCMGKSRPEIIYANPCKATGHLVEAVCKGIHLVTFDNLSEVMKCAAISKKIQLILRIITDDRGSHCRLSSKFGAPRHHWRPLLQAAQQHGLQVVGVAFHVGSGCRDATCYERALKDARDVFDLAESEFGMKLHLVDIGGGFPGETQSMLRSDSLFDDVNVKQQEEHDRRKCVVDDDDDQPRQGLPENKKGDNHEKNAIIFTDMAKQVSQYIDQYFPADSSVRVIAEPGRYFVAACATLCCSVLSTRRCNDNNNNNVGGANTLQQQQQQQQLPTSPTTRIRQRPNNANDEPSNRRSDEDDNVKDLQCKEGKFTGGFQTKDRRRLTTHGDIADSSLVNAIRHLAQRQNFIGLGNFEPTVRLPFLVADTSYESPLGTRQMTTEMTRHRQGWGSSSRDKANVHGTMIPSKKPNDVYAYYISEGVYTAFKDVILYNLRVCPRVLRRRLSSRQRFDDNDDNGLDSFDDALQLQEEKTDDLYSSTIYGPTCNPKDVVARSVLLPKLKVDDWIYFQNMGAYTMATASVSFHSFDPCHQFYVCSIRPDFFLLNLSS